MDCGGIAIYKSWTAGAERAPHPRSGCATGGCSLVDPVGSALRVAEAVRAASGHLVNADGDVSPHTEVRQVYAAMRVDEKVAELVAERLRILGQPLRIRLLERLQCGPATVRELTEDLAAVQQNVSQHLAVMHKAGILERRKAGTRVFYELSDTDWITILEMTRAALGRQSQELARLSAALTEQKAPTQARAS